MPTISLEPIRPLIQTVLHAVGLEVRRAKNANLEPYVLKNILNATGASIVLDVGANIGQYGDALLREGFNGTLVSFEAIPDVHGQLLEHAKRRSRSWLVAPCAALGSSNGQIEINIAGNSVSSSILPMTSTHLDAAPQSRYVQKQIVNIARLDEIAEPLIPANGTMLIKVDTQGYEMEVLKGATGLLERTVALQLELSLVPLYDGAPTIAEVISFAAAKGFELYNLIPGFKDKRSGRLLQADGFFVRGRDSPPFKAQEPV
jgi:FkbM family methyltransferase